MWRVANGLQNVFCSHNLILKSVKIKRLPIFGKPFIYLVIEYSHLNNLKNTFLFPSETATHAVIQYCAFHIIYCGFLFKNQKHKQH